MPSKSRLALDFGTDASAKAAGFTRVSDAGYNAARGYGFKNAGMLQTVDRGGGALTRDFLKGRNGLFRADLNRGVYVVTAFFGDNKAFHDAVHIVAENAFIGTVPATVRGEFVTRSFLVQLNDRQLNLNFFGNNGSKFALNGLRIAPWNLTANAGADVAAKEGSLITFQGQAAAQGPFSYHWNFSDGSTVFGTLTPSKIFAEQGTYQATLTVTDVFGFQRQDVTTVTVSNAAPTATLTSGGAVNEGSTGSVSFSNQFDPSLADVLAGFRYSYDFDNNGSFEISNSTSASATVPASYLADGPSSRTVRGRIIDQDGGFTDYLTGIPVNNVAPSVTLNNVSGTTSAPTSFSASVSDVSSIDAAAGFTYAWNFGDGGTSTQANPSHNYVGGGTYQVTLKVKDKDGAETTRTAQAFITADGANPYSTPFETFPNFGAAPTLVSIASGVWSDPGTWSANRVPAANDVIAIRGNTVTFDVSMVSADAVKTIVVENGGKLVFATGVSTKLYVSNFMVLPGGELEVGTPANPVLPDVTAEIWFANKPLDTAFDPDGYGNGLIALGKVTMAGAEKPDGFIRLASEPRAGQTTLTLSQPATGWRVGDRLVIPDSRHLTEGERGQSNYVTQVELRYIESISPDRLTLTLTASLTYDHFGARDAQDNLEFLPHVMNLTRNVVVKSESASGNRGHVMFTYRADVHVQYVQFSGLGRTRNSDVEDDTFELDEHRNSVQFRHLFGPTSPQANGYQYTFVGNSVFCPLTPMPFAWGINIRDSHYGWIKDNVLYNWAGAGLAASSGSESHNVIEHNMVARTNGTSIRDDRRGHAGSGFWFRGPNNIVRNNVATTINGGAFDVYTYGFAVNATFLGSVNVPAFKGADLSQAAQRVSTDMNATPLREFAGNEVYGATMGGITVWWLGAFGETVKGEAGVIQGFRVWHHSVYGAFLYESNNLVIDGFVARGDLDVVDNQFEGALGIWSADYMTRGLTIKNANIQGLATGIMTPTHVGRGLSGDTTTIEDSYLNNVTNVSISPPRSVNGSGGLSPKTTVMRNVTFAHPTAINSSRWNDVSMDDVDSDSLGTSNRSVADLAFVYDYNGDPDDDFQVFYTDRSPADAVIRALIDGKVKDL